MSKNNPQTYQIANFALTKNFKDLKPAIVDQLKKHLLDSVGSLIHCLHRPTIQKLINQIKMLDAGGNCTVPVIGKISLDRAVQFYTALIRYPDFMDNYLGKEATCHPSDNIGPLLAASSVVNISGEEFLIAMAIGYEIECRLVEEVPVMIKGFDHTVLLSYSITAELCRVFQLTEEQTANALSIAGGSFNPLVTCRASYTKEWKGLMSSIVAFGCMNIVMLAKENMTGPTQLFEGKKGFQELGLKLKYNWNEDHFDLIHKCMLKSYNSEVHTQSLVEAAVELKKKNRINPEDIESIEAITFLTAYHIVGGGEYGDRHTVYSKEQADHSLPYVLSVALLDDEVYPEQLLEERIMKTDVQELLKKVKVTTKLPFQEPKKVAGALDQYTRVYPEKMMGELKIKMKNGKEFSLEKEDYYGFYKRPMSWTDVKKKFLRLTKENANKELQQQIIDVISNLQKHNMKDLVKLLAKTGKQTKKSTTRTMGHYKKAS